MRVGFLGFWGDFNPRCNYFTELVRTKYDVEIVNGRDNPDILFFSGSRKWNHRDDVMPGTVKVRVNGESSVAYRNPPEAAHVHFTHNPTEGNNIFFPLWITYIDWFKNTPAEYYTCSGSLSPLSDLFDRDISRFNKSKFCTYIAKHPGSEPPAHRANFVKELTKYKHVDCPGKDLNNCDWGSTQHIIKPGQDRPGDKLEFIQDYKFNIAFENRSLPYYTTEKCMQPFTVCTIPVYWGGSAIFEDFNNDAFIYVDNFKEGIEKIKEVDNSDSLFEDMISTNVFKNDAVPERFTTEYLLAQIEKHL